jgi:hypothetical protein
VAAAWSGGVLRLTLDRHVHEAAARAVLPADADIVAHPLAEVAHVLTALNPGGRPGPLDRNLAAYAALPARLRDYDWHVMAEAASRHPGFA